MAYVNVKQDIEKWTKHFKDSITSHKGKFKKVKQSGSGEPKVVTVSLAKLGENMASSEYKNAEKTYSPQSKRKRRRGNTSK